MKINKLICILALLFSAQGLPLQVLGNALTIEDFETEKKFDQLQLLLQKRLAIMHEVARTKWNQNLAIEDKVREEQILKGLIEQGQKYGLDEKWISKFFQIQFDAAKDIQREDFIVWKEQGIDKFPSVLSLKDELRIYIDQINQEIFVLLSQLNNKGNLNNKFIMSSPISNRETDQIKENIWELAISPF
jgi:chorismate mutase-like protein